MRASLRRLSGMSGLVKSGILKAHGRRLASLSDEQRLTLTRLRSGLIRMFSVKGETVLDPFLGSGTTAKVAIINERNSVGYESDSKLLPDDNSEN